MTANEAQRVREQYMAATPDDLLSQINATHALFVMVEELQQAIAARDMQITALQHLTSSLFKHVTDLDREVFGEAQTS